MAYLTYPDILELAACLRQSITDLQRLRAERPLASHIKSPQIPPLLSESLVAHLITQGTILPEWQQATMSHSPQADVLLRLAGKQLKVEVKATGDKGFQRLSTADVICDVLVWVHFGHYFKRPEPAPITVYVIKNPGRYYRAGKEAFAAEVETKVGEGLEKLSLEV